MRLSPELAAALARLHAAAFADQEARWSAREIAAFAQGAPGADASVLIAWGGPPVGFGLLRAAAGEAELLTLAVDPRHRRRGVGSSLMAQMAEAAWGAGAAEIFLEVAETNIAARALYRAAGFAEVGRRRGYHRSGDRSRVDALILRKPL